MSVRYRNERTGDEIDLPAVDKRLEALSNWHRIVEEPTALSAEDKSEMLASAGSPVSPAAPKPAPKRKPRKKPAATTSAAPESARSETPEPPADADPLQGS